MSSHGSISKVAATLLLSTSLMLADNGVGGGLNNSAVSHKKAQSKEQGSDWVEFYLKLISVTANRSETELSKYAGQIGVADQSLEKSPSLIDAISEIPGVSFGEDFGRQAGQQFNIRGFGYQSEDRVIVAQDGVKRSTGLYSSMISTFRTDNDLLKRVEIVKGASSVLHGSGAIGGIVSMQTKNVDDFIKHGKSYGLMLGHRSESNKMYSERAAVAFKPQENLGILLYGKHSKFGTSKLADGGRGDTKYVKGDEQINTLFGKIEYKITDTQGLDFSIYNFHENLTTGWQSLWWSEPGDTPTIGTIKQRDYNVQYHYNPDSPLVNLQAQYFNSSASYHRERGGNDYINQERRWGINVKNESLFGAFGVDHTLVFGSEYERRREDAAFLAKGVLRDFNSHPSSYEDYGLYAQDLMGIGDFEITAGGRFDYFKREVLREGRSKYNASRFSPKIALAYEVLEGINLLAGYSETFRAPTPHETSSFGYINRAFYYLPNSNLKPEIAREVEFGFSINRELLGGDQLYFKATHFVGEIKDMIAIRARKDLGVPPPDGSLNPQEYGQYQNVDKAKRLGYELEGRYNVGNLATRFSYGHLKLYDAATNERISVYADKITLGADYKITPWDLALGANLTHWLKPKRDKWTRVIRGKTYHYVDSEYTLVNLNGVWKPKNLFGFQDGMKMGFGVRNLFDKPYTHPNNYKNTAAVGRGRNFYIDVELKF